VSQAIKNCLAQHGIDIKKARGQAYDGGSNMSGKMNGSQALIKQTVPQALYVHCNSHLLNLAIMKSCSLPAIRNMVDLLNSIFLFFDLSPKRQRLLERVIRIYGTGKVNKLKGLCKTRWVERHTCFETFAEMYRVIVISLEALLYPNEYCDVYTLPNNEDMNEKNGIDEFLEEWAWDQDARTRAQGLLASMKSTEIMVTFCTTKNVIHFLKSIASKLQKRDMDIYQAYMMIDDTINQFRNVRIEIDVQFADWYSEAEDLAKTLSVELKMPRLAGRQMNRANPPSNSPQDYFKMSVAIPFLDHLIMEMETRFGDRIGSSLFKLLPSNIVIEENLYELCQTLLFWESDLPTPTALLSELKDWLSRWQNDPNKPGNLQAALHAADGDQFPNISKLLIIGCTLPIGSAEAERSFSALRKTKTFLRSTMSQERLSGLALMNIHHDITLNIADICKTYVQRHPRRMFETFITRM